jgi:NDP-sugar pyrophosphorylase family protein
MRSGGILHLPVLNSSREVVGLETLQELFHTSSLNNPVVLMAGGFGTRLKPLTDRVPKPLLNVGGKPLLEIIINQFIRYGFNRFFISTHYKGEQVREYFGDGKKWDISISYIHEAKPLGTAGALRLLPTDIGDEPIFLMNGDILSNTNFRDMLQFHKSSDSDCTIAVREYETRIPYGVVKTEGIKAMTIVEKPSYTNFVNAGIYVLNRAVLDIGRSPKYLEMPKFLTEKIITGSKVNVFPIHEYWLDIGQTGDYVRAQHEAERLPWMESDS